MTSKSNLIILFSILILSCAQERKENIAIKIIDSIECNNCVEPSSCINLTFHNIESTIEIDWLVFDLFEDNFNDSKLLKDHTLDEILEMIDDNQIVIENSKSEKRFFSDIKTFENETIPVTSVFKITEEDGSTDILKPKEDISRNICINTNRLKIRKNDEKIRVYWLIKNSKEGGKYFILKSNWMDMK